MPSMGDVMGGVLEMMEGVDTVLAHPRKHHHGHKAPGVALPCNAKTAGVAPGSPCQQAAAAAAVPAAVPAATVSAQDAVAASRIHQKNEHNYNYIIFKH